MYIYVYTYICQQMTYISEQQCLPLVTGDSSDLCVPLLLAVLDVLVHKGTNVLVQFADVLVHTAQVITCSKSGKFIRLCGYLPLHVAEWETYHLF